MADAIRSEKSDPATFSNITHLILFLFISTRLQSHTIHIPTLILFYPNHASPFYLHHLPPFPLLPSPQPFPLPGHTFHNLAAHYPRNLRSYNRFKKEGRQVRVRRQARLLQGRTGDKRRERTAGEEGRWEEKRGEKRDRKKWAGGH